MLYNIFKTMFSFSNNQPTPQLKTKCRSWETIANYREVVDRATRKKKRKTNWSGDSSCFCNKKAGKQKKKQQTKKGCSKRSKRQHNSVRDFLLSSRRCIRKLDIPVPGFVLGHKGAMCLRATRVHIPQLGSLCS